MSWEEVDKKHKKRTDRDFVSCEEKWELDYLKKIIKEEFPTLRELDIENAIKHCCKNVPAPRKRTDFINCLKKQLLTT